MLKGSQISGIGAIIFAGSLIISHAAGFYLITDFFTGIGCSLTLVGAVKRFIEAR